MVCPPLSGTNPEADSTFPVGLPGISPGLYAVIVHEIVQGAVPLRFWFQVQVICAGTPAKVMLLAA